MKRTYILPFVAFCISYLSAYSQLSEGGLPPSFNHSSALRSVVSDFKAPVNLDVKRLIWEDEMADKNGAVPRIAIDIPIDVDIEDTGMWTTLSDSTRIWRQNITADNAVGLIVSYSDFYIPKGGKLFIYNQDKSHILGGYTNETHPKGGRFATEPIYGDSFTFEYVASTISDEKPRIAVEGLGYIYNNRSTFSLHAPNPQINTPPGGGGTTTCRINANCPQGSIWEKQKRGTVLLYIKYYSTWGACSGSLINNTARDGKPYVLTASHCFDYGVDVQFDQLIVNFNYEFPGCKNETVIPDYKSLVGVNKLVHIPLQEGSDHFLFEIKRSIPKEWKPYYNGWDRSNNAAQSGVVMHHPNWDVKKMITYAKPVTTMTYIEGGKAFGAPNAHWRIVYDGSSITEVGSSGSPLFNQNGLIVGVLTGGQTFCESLFAPDFYGKLWYGWDQYTGVTSTEKKLKVYLDPLNTGVQTLSGHDPNGPVSGIEGNENTEIKELVIFPNPVEGELNINTSSIIRSITIHDLQGRQMFTQSGYSSSTAEIHVGSLNKGAYTITIQTENKKLTEKFFKK